MSSILWLCDLLQTHYIMLLGYHRNWKLHSAWNETNLVPVEILDCTHIPCYCSYCICCSMYWFTNKLPWNRTNKERDSCYVGVGYKTCKISMELPFHTSMVYNKTTVTPVRKQWSYCSLALSHRHDATTLANQHAPRKTDWMYLRCGYFRTPIRLAVRRQLK